MAGQTIYIYDALFTINNLDLGDSLVATLNPRRFAQPDALKAINPTRLLLFLDPYMSYLNGREMTWPDNDSEEINYVALADILMKPDDQMPPLMVDALYFVHEMATPEEMDNLIKAAKDEGIELDHDPDTTPADIAAQVWLKAPALLESMHAEVLVMKPKSFTHFKSQEFGPKTFMAPDEKTVEALQSELDLWFDDHKRGAGSKVLYFDYGDKISFLVRHGMPFKREGSLNEGQSGTVFYRPEIHDVLVYDRIVNEMSVHTGTKGERELYLAAFGRHLFGDAEYFPDTDKFTLEPLKSGDPNCLACGDIDGIEEVKLIELQRFLGGPYGDIEIRKSKNYLASLAARSRPIPEKANLILASFSIKFDDAKNPRSVKIRPSNVATYTRDDDSQLVEKWLLARGFIIEREEEADAAPVQAVASA